MEPLRFEAEWARCAPWIEGALAYAGGTHLIEDVREMVLAGDAQFWPGERAAIVSEVLVYPRLKNLHLWLVGGDLKELLRMRLVLEAWGAARGCVKVTTAGRPGWRRVLGKHGYGAGWDVCVKELI